ncbi:cation diffusion facilitator family transporter [Sediminivirga luteola]|uniref:cation diffusion facilitator family transporter n=1 Tax=Sediminivirga luteola TaxID=1774748 RepID=UPI001F5692CF|nr:cation diffusion facilitator family transporter [Sediminivirga luteola]MCI2267002.1 cation diffusion facilitator family transporter [Sediminivirga luteola]
MSPHIDPGSGGRQNHCPTSPDDHRSHEHHHDHGHQGFWGRIRHALVPHSHDHSEAIRTADEASAYGIRAAWFSLAGMGATALLQIFIVALSGSIALLADTVHNLGHLATTIPLIIAFRLGRRAPTRRYPYGYKRAEDLVGLFIGLIIAASAALIIWESIRGLIEPRPLTHLGWVLAAALVGAAGNEAVAIYRIRAGRRIGSAALIAEGQHARTDALTSVAVIASVIGAWFGLPQLDAIIGLLIAAVIIAVLTNSMRTVVHRLMDGTDPATLDVIEHTAAAVSGVRTVEDARARWLGHRLECELTLTLATDTTIANAEAIASEARQRLHQELPYLDRTIIEFSSGKQL